MNQNTLHVIVGNRGERYPRLMKELEQQGINDYELWDGIFLRTAKEGINAAHRQIVEYAKVAGWEYVRIAEDDFQATHPNSWHYYISQTPQDFDLYLSMIYLGDIDDKGTVKSFTGMTLYTVHSRFYDTFLSVNPQEHIDHELANKGIYKVCQPFTFKQYNGISSNTGKYESYDILLQNRQFFNG